MTWYWTGGGKVPVWKMRRLFALMLIAISGWLFYRTANTWLGGVDHILSPSIAGYLDQPDFLFPMAGSVLALLGGLTVFFGGPGGAVIALLGGIGVAGFALSIDQTLDLNHFWDNQLAVGVVMLMLAAMTGSMSRGSQPSSFADDDGGSRTRRTF
jgi:hypothetical protein